MTAKRNIVLTLDYELFLGKQSGAVTQCVIEPTQKICNLLSQYRAKAIFFVDTLWLVRLKEASARYEAAKSDYHKAVTQLQHIVKTGHYLFNHLHPHWLDAQYLPDLNQWTLTDQSKYRFSTLDKKERDSIFAQTTQLLEQIIKPVNPTYSADGYRAGGWSIQPFSHFIPYFVQYGIKHDFSVIPGIKSITTAQQYNYTNILNCAPYRFCNNPCKPEVGDFTEYPISTIHIPPIKKQLNRFLLKYLWIKGDRGYGNGFGVAPKVLEQSISSTEMASIELLTRVKLNNYMRFLKKYEYMQFISHPKMLSGHNINTFAQFMKKAFTRYSVETDFKNMLL